MLRIIATSVAQAVAIVLIAELLWFLASYVVVHNSADIGALVILALYPLPIAVATLRKHNKVLDIMVTNLWLGWTVVGWVLVMIWACNWDVEAVALPQPR